MEQIFGAKTGQILTQIVLYTVLSLVLGCKQPEPNPELKDPIFNDLKAQLAATSGEVDKAVEDIKAAKESLEKLEVRTTERKQTIRQISTLEKKLSELQQMKIYYEVRIEQRKAFVQKDYLRAFHAEKPWPNPEEFERYKTVKNLRTAPKSWDTRVPKLTRHNKQVLGPDSAKKKEEKPTEGAAPKH